MRVVAIGLIAGWGLLACGGGDDAASEDPAPVEVGEGYGDCGAALLDVATAADGTVVGRFAEGKLVEGEVFAAPLIDDYAIFASPDSALADGSEPDALLALVQPPVRLLSCRDGLIAIEFPMCDELETGWIRQVDPVTGEPPLEPAEGPREGAGC
jgi:hypothetical protein